MSNLSEIIKGEDLHPEQKNRSCCKMYLAISSQLILQIIYKGAFYKGDLWKVHEGVVSHSRLTTGPVGPVYGRTIATLLYRQRQPTGSTTDDYSISITYTHIRNLVLVIFSVCATGFVNIPRVICGFSRKSALLRKIYLFPLKS